MLVFSEFAGLTLWGRLLVVGGSSMMIAGAVAISMAAPPPAELEYWRAAMNRECVRYGLNAEQVGAIVAGNGPAASDPRRRRWWEIIIVCAATAIFVWLAAGTRNQHIALSIPWMIILIVGTIIPLGAGGALLWRRTRFS